MKRLATATCALALVSLCACPLAACAPTQSQSASAEASASGSSQLDESVRANIESAVAQARETSYDSVTFSMTTDTTSSATDDKGNLQQQTVRTKMSGELDKSGEKPVMHMSYEGSSSTQLEKTTYDMYIDNTGVIISQKGQLYKDAINDDMLNSYVATVTSTGSEEELSQLLDVASSYEMKETDKGDTAITIVVDVNKLADTQLVDTSSLPEGSAVATLVASYVIDADHHFKSVRMLSSTTGTPTYRVDQNYEFSNYNTTVMPEWPDMAAYIAEQAGIMTDDQGRMYMIADDGQTYYVESIDDEGMIHFQTS